MSKFFRSGTPSSDGSGDSDGDSDSDSTTSNTEEALSPVVSHVNLSRRHEDTGSSVESVRVDRSRSPSAINVAKDWLIHSLLEERCRTQIIEQRRLAGKSVHDQDAIQRETRERYQSTCAQLSAMNFVSTGLDGDRYHSTRESVRAGLDRLAATNTVATPVSQQVAIPALTSSRPLANANDFTMSLPFSSLDAPSILHAKSTGLSALPPSRYREDFLELGVLGRGGFGTVYHVFHNIDRCEYAVKKIPIRPSLMAKIATGGQAVLDTVLAEVRSLSRLQHPNIVRYYSSWIEWSTVDNPELTSDGTISGTGGYTDAVADVKNSRSTVLASLSRIRMESDTLEDIGFTFEASHSTPGANDDHSSTHAPGHHATDAPGGVVRPFPVLGLTLHIQMSVHPMTLAKFLSSSQPTDDHKMLTHCFHLAPSIRILVALLDGIEYIHEEGIVHRDLKPANIFLKREVTSRASQGCVDLSTCSDCQHDGSRPAAKVTVCIGDFGLVTQMSHETEPSPAEAVGTEIYRPTSSKSSNSPRLDIFALGMIACELLHKFDTQMERRETMQKLREGNLDENFASCAGPLAGEMRNCVGAMLATEGPGDNVPVSELRRRLSGILEQSQRLEHDARSGSELDGKK